MGDPHHTLNPEEEKFYKHLQRQFGKDADRFMINPNKYSHHFDKETLSAYDRIFTLSECHHED